MIIQVIITVTACVCEATQGDTMYVYYNFLEERNEDFHFQ